MELLDIRDIHGNLTGQVKEREKVHEDGDIHGTSHVWIMRMKAGGGCDLLLQKRSADKDSFPGCYDISSAGHIPAGEDHLTCALRELNEELGVTASPEDLIELGMHEGYTETEFSGKPFKNYEIAKVYLYTKPIRISDLTLQKEEVESVKWMDLEECIQKAKDKDPDYILWMKELEMIKKWISQGTSPDS